MFTRLTASDRGVCWRALAVPAVIVALLIAVTHRASLAETLPHTHGGVRVHEADEPTETGGDDVELEGSLEVLYEHRRDGSIRYHHVLTTSDGTAVPLEGVQRDHDLLTGDRVRVRGARSRRALQLRAASAETLQVMQYAPLANTLGVQKVAVLLVNFSNDRRQPYTVEQARAELATTDAFFRENSYGQTSLAFDVFGWYTLPMSNASCTTSSIMSYAQSAAAAAGVNLSPYTRFVYAMPHAPSCYAGFATLGGRPSHAWISGDTLLAMLVAHELGHNFGLRHAHAMRCAPGVALGGSCSVLEYGDVTDTMGASDGHFSAFQKQRLGWLGYGASPPITLVEDSGVYTIEAYADAGDRPKVLKIPRRPGEFFFVESRRKDRGGFDSQLFRSGVYVHLATDADPDSSFLLDMVPDTLSWYADTGLPVGRSFTDAVSGITITTLAESSAEATIMVSMGSSCTRARPTVTASPRQGPAVGPGTPVAYNISVTNADSAACGGSSFRLQASGPTGWTKTFSVADVTVSPGATVSTVLHVASPAVAPGTYTVVGTATHSLVSALSGSDSVSYTVQPSGGSGGGPGGGSGGTLIDTFDRPDTATTLGNGWSTVSGSFGVQSHHAASSPTQAMHAAVQPTLRGITHTAMAEFTSSNNNHGPRFGLFARYVDAGNYYACYRQVGGTSTLRIARVVNGVETILKSVNVSNPSRNVPFTVSCQVVGTTITAGLGGTRITATDATLSTGATGFFVRYAPGRGKGAPHVVDNFQAAVQ